MPESSVSALHHFISFEDSDELFGDFKFASNSSPPPPPPNDDDDEGWSDFFVGAAAVKTDTTYSPFDPFPNVVASSPDPISAPARPGGALPLSIFGEEEAEEPKLGFSSVFGKSEGKGSGGAGSGGDLRDLIKTLYGAPAVKGVDVERENGGFDDEDGWEFQDAVSESADAKNLSNGSYSSNYEGDSLHLGLQNGGEKEAEEEEDDSWEFKDALADNGVVSSSSEQQEASGTEVHITADVHQSDTKNTFTDFYCKLKDGSTFLVYSYINDLKESQEAAMLSGAHGMAKRINGKIEEAQSKLLEAEAADVGNLGKYPSKDVCVSQLFEALVEPSIQSFVQEYGLSKRILLADKSLEGAIELLEHSTSILHTLSLVPQEEQHSYIVVWSKIAAVCLHELQNGVKIWKEAIYEGVSAELLSQEGWYFHALGEIYRSAEILRVSVKFYKPWLLSDSGNTVKLTSILDQCTEMWLSSGLEKTLENVSGSNGLQTTVTVETLHCSIKAVHELNNFLCQSHSLRDEKICRLSLLPLATLQEMKMVTWNGEPYCVKLANLWANRISPNPPLSSIHL